MIVLKMHEVKSIKNISSSYLNLTCFTRAVAAKRGRSSATAAAVRVATAKMKFIPTAIVR